MLLLLVLVTSGAPARAPFSFGRRPLGQPGERAAHQRPSRALANAASNASPSKRYKFAVCRLSHPPYPAKLERRELPLRAFVVCRADCVVRKFGNLFDAVAHIGGEIVLGRVRARNRSRHL